jgi:hypothetical protein
VASQCATISRHDVRRGLLLLSRSRERTGVNNLRTVKAAAYCDCSSIVGLGPHCVSHSGLLEPRGTSTVLKDPGVFDRTTWSVMP